MIRARINGEEREFGDDTSLSEMMDAIGVPSARGIAVAVNDAVIPRAQHAAYRPKDGDAIEIIKAVAGG